MPPTEPPTASSTVAAFELVPGHAATEAEVFLWSGPVAQGVTEQPGPFVVFRGDDWPMSAAVARQLAAALVEAADRAEGVGEAVRGPDGERR